LRLFDLNASIDRLRGVPHFLGMNESWRGEATEPVLARGGLGDNSDEGNVARAQQSGFAYLSWTSETLNVTSSEMIQSPLSRPRTTPKSQRGFTLGTGDEITARQTSTVVRLHAGMAKRIYSVTQNDLEKSSMRFMTRELHAKLA